MRRLGSLERLSQGKGIAVLNTETPPNIGETVVDETLTEIGTIVDIIGPTAAPYAVITPNDSVDLIEHLDAKLYLR